MTCDMFCVNPSILLCLDNAYMQKHTTWAVEKTCPTCSANPISLRKNQKFLFTCPELRTSYQGASDEYLQHAISKKNVGTRQKCHGMFSSRKRKMSIFGLVNLVCTSEF